ncbi:hypothetical protein DWF00_27440 [Bosea caraganae]|nr:hypothetical protein DWF00_27440 [Bosea caraganae]
MPIWSKWIGAGLVLCTVLGVLVFKLAHLYGPACTADVIESQSALARSNQTLQGIANADQSAKCAAYRAHAAVLTRAAPVAATCGPAQFTRGAARPSLDGELSFYKRLVDEQCR